MADKLLNGMTDVTFNLLVLKRYSEFCQTTCLRQGIFLKQNTTSIFLADNYRAATVPSNSVQLEKLVEFGFDPVAVDVPGRGESVGKPLS